MVELLRGRWGIAVQSLEYAPVGFGSYHWIVIDTGGSRWFVTADHLLTMASQDSPDPEANFGGLLAAYETASALAATGLDFVVPPILTLDGNVAARVAADWVIALFP